MFAPGSYSVQAQGNGEALTLQWLNQAMYTVSAWAPASDGDAGGGGSTVSASVSTWAPASDGDAGGGGSTVSASVSTTASHSQQS
jgi:hypothetical protein